MRLITLITECESMNKQEKDYWISLIPSMTPKSQDRLAEILQIEKDKLAEIDARFTS